MAGSSSSTSISSSSSPERDGEKLEATTPDEQIKASAPDALPPSEAPIPTQKKYSIYTTLEKRLIVFAAALGAFFSPLSAQIYFPALGQLASDLQVSVTQINLTVTTYMIVQGIAPMFVGSLADSAGRRPAYLLCFIIYIAACVGCALTPNYGGLLALRALQAGGSSATVSLCQAVVSDVVTSAERGSYVGFTALPTILAPSLGPVIGGLISQYLGWRWIFWFLTIFAGAFLAVFLLFVPETCRPIVGDGSIEPAIYYRTAWQLIKDARRRKGAAADDGEPKAKPTTRIQKPNVIRTLHILFEKEMFLLLMYGALFYAGFYALATALPTIFADLYGFNGLLVGLIYLPIGVGSVVAVFIMGKLTNWNYRRHCKRLGIPYDRSRQQNMADFPIEHVRLQIGIPFLILYTAVQISFGWAVQYHAHLAAAIVLLFLTGFSLVAFTNLLATLIVDINPGVAGSATAANNLTRCLLGAGSSAFINPLMSAVGSGWAFTIFGLSYIFFSPVMWLLLKYGAKWRAEKVQKAELKKQREQQQLQEKKDSSS
ncbi:MFS general substrate transporter [Xylaria arbuscula]|nr:MFS general substrate transporter [Xylaria arbuscula]